MISRSLLLMLLLGLVPFAAGCALVPDVRSRSRFHNPLPQIHRVAVLPFFNQSSEPTINQIAVAEAYYASLQSIPGFEVVPVGVTIAGVESYVGMLATGGKYRSEKVFLGGSGPVVPWEQIDFGQINFQELARGLGVDAVVVGAVTDFSPYYPPRMAMTTRWYAANPGFHPVPAGYGLPWGTRAEKKIPRWIKLETELEVARAQLATQAPVESPLVPLEVPRLPQPPAEEAPSDQVQEADFQEEIGVTNPMEALEHEVQMEQLGTEAEFCEEGSEFAGDSSPAVAPYPAMWPDPARLIPAAPDPSGPPLAQPQGGPILTHTRLYRGDDMDFTERLAEYVYANDDGRLGGWEGYLNRSDDFIRFCCYLHITEMLEMRGGRDKSDLIIRWPISRYSR